MRRTPSRHKTTLSSEGELTYSRSGFKAEFYRMGMYHTSSFIWRLPFQRGKIGWSSCRAFTLVEMLVAMAITLVMMAAVVTLFANVTNSVRNRRATTEMTGLLRHVRNTLQQDLQVNLPGRYLAAARF